MDKILVTQKDLDFLMKWRDTHKDLVRTIPAAFKGINIINKEIGLNVKCIRDGDVLTFYPFCKNRPIGKFQCRIFSYGYSIINQKLLTTEDGKQADVQSIMTIYASLMAYIVYGKEEKDRQLVGFMPKAIQDSTLTKPKRKRTGNAVTYIFTKGNNIIGNGRIITGRRKPQVTFTVRGHFREYKSGKRVWISQFTKGAGKKKDKNYKLGGHKENG